MWLCCALCFRQPKMTRYHRFTDPLCADVCILVCRGLQQARLSSLEGCTVSNRGQRPRIAATHSVSAWRAVRPRRWRREPQREGALCVDEDGLKAELSLPRAVSSQDNFHKTLFLTEKHLAVKPLFDLTNSESSFG